MDIDRRRLDRGVAQQFLDLVDAAAGVNEIAAERVPQLVRGHPPGQSRPPARRGDKCVDRIR
jgi:hypothetical protein